VHPSAYAGRIAHPAIVYELAIGAHCREEIATLERRVQQAERQRHELQAKQAALHAQLRCANVGLCHGLTQLVASSFFNSFFLASRSCFFSGDGRCVGLYGLVMAAFGKTAYRKCRSQLAFRATQCEQQDMEVESLRVVCWLW
jgi:hypothetical protein